VSDDADDLPALRALIAEQHLGDGRYGDFLHNRTADGLRREAERLRPRLGLFGPDRPSPEAAWFLHRQEQARWHERLFGSGAA
jgi:hypothetical protein